MDDPGIPSKSHQNGKPVQPDTPVTFGGRGRVIGKVTNLKEHGGGLDFEITLTADGAEALGLT